MLIKTQRLASVPYGFFDCASETYEIWVNPAFVTSVLPELKSIKLLGEKEYTKLIELLKMQIERHNAQLLWLRGEGGDDA